MADVCYYPSNYNTVKLTELMILKNTDTDNETYNGITVAICLVFSPMRWMATWF